VLVSFARRLRTSEKRRRRRDLGDGERMKMRGKLWLRCYCATGLVDVGCLNEGGKRRHAETSLSLWKEKKMTSRFSCARIYSMPLQKQHSQ
jgi:hypothetical protein